MDKKKNKNPTSGLQLHYVRPHNNGQKHIVYIRVQWIWWHNFTWPNRELQGPWISHSFQQLWGSQEESIGKKYGNSGSFRWESEWDSLWFRFHKEDVKINAVICKTCHKTAAAKGSSITNLFRQLKSYPLKNEDCFKLCMSTSSHTSKKMINKPAVKNLCVQLKVKKKKKTAKTKHLNSLRLLYSK